MLIEGLLMFEHQPTLLFPRRGQACCRRIPVFTRARIEACVRTRSWNGTASAVPQFESSRALQAAEKGVVAKMSGAKSRGIPHLAKNERDVGHPGSCLGQCKKPRG
jgi:hypothetical protein